MVSLLKEYWGDAATAENDYCFDYLPRIDRRPRHLPHGAWTWSTDKVNGYFLLGPEPGRRLGARQAAAARAWRNLDWLVVRDLAMIESATFWKDAPEIETGEIVTEECRTEVFFFPAASHVEKEGTFTQTQRMLQWREKAVEPPGDAALGPVVLLPPRAACSGSGWRARPTERDRPLLDLTWDYPTHGRAGRAVSAEDGAAARSTATTSPPARPVNGYLELKADGSTAVRLLDLHAASTPTGSTRPPGASRAREQSPGGAEWGWAWPANRRILYNRASADPDGKPWSERKKLRLVGRGRRASGPATTSRTSRRPSRRRTGRREGAAGAEGLRGDDPFIMQADGKGWLYAPNGVLDGPLPTHYEPHESPVRNPLYGQQAQPDAQGLRARGQPVEPVPAGARTREVFPFVFTTSRLTEHHTAGGMSRQLPYLSELQPEMFVEVSPELAAERGLTHLGWATWSPAGRRSRRGCWSPIGCRRCGSTGRVVHQVWLPYHWGGERPGHR